MEHLLDFQITKVYEPKKEGKPIEGIGEYGDWKLYNFYTDKTGKEKFSFMWGEKKPIPTEGLKIKHMEYESETKGQYTNLNVKKLELSEKSTPTGIANAKEDMGAIPKAKNDREVSFYVAYAKDIAVAMINGGRFTEELLVEIVSSVAKAGVKLMNESLNNGQISSQESVKRSTSEDKTKDKGSGKGSSPQQEEDQSTGQKKDRLTEAFLRSVEEIQKELVMSLGEAEAAKAVDSALNRYEAKSFEDVKKSEHGAFIGHLGNLKDKS